MFSFLKVKTIRVFYKITRLIVLSFAGGCAHYYVPECLACARLKIESPDLQTYALYPDDYTLIGVYEVLTGEEERKIGFVRVNAKEKEKYLQVPATEKIRLEVSLITGSYGSAYLCDGLLESRFQENLSYLLAVRQSGGKCKVELLEERTENDNF